MTWDFFLCKNIQMKKFKFLNIEIATFCNNRGYLYNKNRMLRKRGVVMFVILVYDVNSSRCAKVMKICKKYLHHVQRSVFEGMITESKLKGMRQELERNITSDAVGKAAAYIQSGKGWVVEVDIFLQ